MITSAELKKLEKLAKIKIQKEEVTPFLNKLSNLVDMINQLQELDCSGYQPLRSVVDAKQPVQQDYVDCDDISDGLFENVPVNDVNAENLAKELKCFVIPKVIE